MRSRAEHLALCKKRAHEYLDAGDITNAITSILSDLEKHPETKSGNTLALLGMHVILTGDRDAAARFIDGFR